MIDKPRETVVDQAVCSYTGSLPRPWFTRYEEARYQGLAKVEERQAREERSGFYHPGVGKLTDDHLSRFAYACRQCQSG